MAATSTTKARGAAARSEVNGKPKTIKIKGVELELPTKVPFRVMRYLSTGEDAGAADVVGVLETILGPEQMERIWEIDVDISKGPEALGTLLDDLTSEVFTAYGLTPGE